MGLLNFIFGKAPVVSDDFFGAMRFVEWKKDLSKNYFECNRAFAPSGKDIELGVDADMPGPSQTQKDFFIEVEKRYAELCATAIPAIEEKLKTWKADFNLKDFHTELDPVYLGLPRCEKQPVQWHLGLELVADRNIHITVRFTGFKESEVEVDT